MSYPHGGGGRALRISTPQRLGHHVSSYVHQEILRLWTTKRSQSLTKPSRSHPPAPFSTVLPLFSLHFADLECTDRLHAAQR